MMKAYFAKDTGKPEVIFDYWLSQPDDRAPGEKLPLVVFLHGAGEVGPDINLVRVHALPKIIEREPYKSLRIVTFSPQCQPGRIWNTQVYELKAQLDWVVKEYGVDEDAISITGLSMGGYGTWMMVQTFPEFFSAAAPVCGGGISWLMSPALVKLPVRIFHGDADTVVPFHNSLDMADALASAGSKNALLTIYHGVGHDSWSNAFEHTDLIKWLSERDRKSVV